MFKKALVVLSVLACVVSSANAFTGSLSGPSGGGISGTGTGWWPATFSWTVTQNQDASWTYNYTFSSTKKSISHLTIEVSPSFTMNDIIAGSFKVLKGSVGDIEIDDFQPHHGSNPGMPGNLYGIKFDSAEGYEDESTGLVTLQISFDSFRQPVWGDFYAKNGKTSGVANTAFNSGFASQDVDPLNAPSDGSVDFHILRPDTLSSNPPVPEPSSLVGLGGTLFGSLVFLRRRREV
jgi:hypothetical protein